MLTHILTRKFYNNEVEISGYTNITIDKQIYKANVKINKVELNYIVTLNMEIPIDKYDYSIRIKMLQLDCIDVIDERGEKILLDGLVHINIEQSIENNNINMSIKCQINFIYFGIHNKDKPINARSFKSEMMLHEYIVYSKKIEGITMELEDGVINIESDTAISISELRKYSDTLMIILSLMGLGYRQYEISEIDKKIQLVHGIDRTRLGRYTFKDCTSELDLLDTVKEYFKFQTNYPYASEAIQSVAINRLSNVWSGVEKSKFIELYSIVEIFGNDMGGTDGKSKLAIQNLITHVLNLIDAKVEKNKIEELCGILRDTRDSIMHHKISKNLANRCITKSIRQAYVFMQLIVNTEILMKIKIKIAVIKDITHICYIGQSEYTEIEQIIDEIIKNKVKLTDYKNLYTT